MTLLWGTKVPPWSAYFTKCWFEDVGEAEHMLCYELEQNSRQIYDYTFWFQSKILHRLMTTLKMVTADHGWYCQINDYAYGIPILEFTIWDPLTSLPLEKIAEVKTAYKEEMRKLEQELIPEMGLLLGLKTKDLFLPEDQEGELLLCYLYF